MDKFYEEHRKIIDIKQYGSHVLAAYVEVPAGITEFGRQLKQNTWNTVLPPFDEEQKETPKPINVPAGENLFIRGLRIREKNAANIAKAAVDLVFASLDDRNKQIHKNLKDSGVKRVSNRMR